MPMPIAVFAVVVYKITYFDRIPFEQVQPAGLFGHGEHGLSVHREVRRGGSCDCVCMCVCCNKHKGI